jgi:hypothetical protein
MRLTAVTRSHWRRAYISDMTHSIGSFSRNLRGMLHALYASGEFPRYLNALYIESIHVHTLLILKKRKGHWHNWAHENKNIKIWKFLGTYEYCSLFPCACSFIVLVFTIFKCVGYFIFKECFSVYRTLIS